MRMKKFLLGFVLGIFLTGCIIFTPYLNPMFRIELKKMLDKDIIYMKDGGIVQGWITNETDNDIFLEIENGYFSLPRSKCKEIKRNFNLQYIRELM